jgi:heterodisulfide reductase subunit B
MGHDKVTTPCPSCLTNLKGAGHKLRKPVFREKVNGLLDEPYEADVDTQPVLQVLWEQVGADAISEKVTKKLSGMRVACYYGCIMNRPPELMDFDDPEHPVVMDKLMEAAGAEVAPFPLKVECCGASFGITRKDIVSKLSGRLLATAEALKVDALVTACPLCQMNLDLRQPQVERACGTYFNIPVFYYTQLLGIAMGLPETELGLNKLAVNPSKALAKITKEKSS